MTKKNDNSVRYVSKVEHSHSEQASPISKDRKNASKNKFLQKKIFIGNITGEGFRILKLLMNCYVQFEKKPTDTMTEQTKTKPQETLEIKMSKQMGTFSFFPPKNLVEEGKWLLAENFFEATNSVFNIIK